MAELPVIQRLRKEAETIHRELTIDLPRELERARAHGDLSENAEYAMAKQRQEFLRARLSNVELRIAELSRINADSVPRDSVGLGSKVWLEDLDDGKEVEFEIVVPEEVDAALNRISLSSPLGKALLGRGQGDEIEVQTPKGNRAYLIRRLMTIHDQMAGDGKRNDTDAVAKGNSSG
jgi:transcription elongation factor GreA